MLYNEHNIPAERLGWGAPGSLVRSWWCCIPALLILFTLTQQASGKSACIRAEYYGMNMDTQCRYRGHYSLAFVPLAVVPCMTFPAYLRTLCGLMELRLKVVSA